MRHRLSLLTLTRLCLLVGVSPTVLADDTVPDNSEPSHAEYVYDARFSPDGSLLVTASGDNTAVVWSTDSWKKRHLLPHDAAVYSAAISSDGKVVATGAGDGSVALWCTATGRLLEAKTLHADAVYSVDFLVDGTQLATAGGSTDGGDTVIRLWQVEAFSVVREFSGHKPQVYGVRFSPDGKMMATSSSDKVIRLWNVATGTFRELQGHTSDVYRCRFSADGQWLASASQDHTVRVWNCSSRQCVGIMKTGQDPAYDMAFSSDGKSLAAVSGDGRLRIWRVSDSETLIKERRVVRSALYTIAMHPQNWSLVVAGESGQLFVLKEGFGDSVLE